MLFTLAQNCFVETGEQLSNSLEDDFRKLHNVWIECKKENGISESG